MSHFDSDIELYRQMAANIPDCSIYIFDEDYDYLLAEGEELSKNGLTSEMLIGSNFFEVWPQEVSMTLAPYYQDTLKGIRQKLEKQFDNGYFIQHYIPLKGEDGTVKAGMVVSQNISELTESRQMISDKDRQLREKQKLLEAVVSTLSEGILVSNKQGEVLLSNPAMKRLLDVEITNNRLQSIADQLLIKNTAQAGEINNSEMPLTIALNGGSLDGYVTFVENKKTGSRSFIESSSRPIRNEKGDVEAGLLVMRNISHRKELEELVGENISTLKQKNDKLEALLREVSQNLRGPSANLNILLSLLDRGKSATEREMFIGKIKEVGNILQSTVSSLSRAILAYTSVQEDWVINHFSDVVKSFEVEYGPELEEVGVKILSNFKKKDEVIYPPNYLNSIIFNILNNVLMFCNSEDQAEIKVESFIEKKEVLLRIISEKTRIDFNQISLDNSIIFGRKYDFSFMGFSIAKSHLEALGGKLTIETDKSLVISF